MGKRSISVPDDLIKRVEKKTNNFSQFVQEAIVEKLENANYDNNYNDARIDKLNGALKSFKVKNDELIQYLIDKESENIK